MHRVFPDRPRYEPIYLEEMTMSFGGGNTEAKAAAALARKGRQSASEEAGRAQQQAERGGTRRKGRSRLLGNLCRDLPLTLGN